MGTIAFAPLIYPFEPWRIKHNHHHAHTNKCAGLLHTTACHHTCCGAGISTIACLMSYRVSYVGCLSSLAQGVGQCGSSLNHDAMNVAHVRMHKHSSSFSMSWVCG